MPDYPTIITCELCGEEHVLRIPSDESVRIWLKGKPSFPIHYMPMIGGVLRKIVCETCRQRNIALIDKQEAERKEFLNI
jgi:hypothetical protein